MILYHTIPKKFKPPSIPTTVKSNSTLSDDFSRQYESIFFSHLNKVLTNDKVDLELTKAAMENIIANTETYLCSLEVPAQVRADLHHQFLTTNQITSHRPLPTLLRKLPQDTTSLNPTQPLSLDTAETPLLGKRKRDDQQQKSTKKCRHFLSLGSQQPPTPP